MGLKVLMSRYDFILLQRGQAVPQGVKKPRVGQAPLTTGMAHLAVMACKAISDGGDGKETAFGSAVAPAIPLTGTYEDRRRSSLMLDCGRS